VGAEHTVSLEVFPLPKQVKVDVTKSRGECIRIPLQVGVSVGKDGLHRVVTGAAGKRTWDDRLENTVCMNLGQRKFGCVREPERHPDSPGTEDACHATRGPLGTDAQDPVGIAMPALQKRMKILRRKACWRKGRSGGGDSFHGYQIIMGTPLARDKAFRKKRAPVVAGDPTRAPLALAKRP
jgi:hypothetical protein